MRPFTTRTRNPAVLLALPLALLFFVTSCETTPPASPTLQSAYKKDFHIGVAINRAIAMNTPFRANNTKRTLDQVHQDIALTLQQFNQISPENDLKWQSIHPNNGPRGYNFAPADAYVNFGLSNHLFIVGHVLIWHNQVPAWVFAGTNSVNTNEFHASREELLKRMHDHIATVVGRYKGKIKVWDVVNEAIDDGGTNLLRNSPWLQIIGPDFIAKAFQFAHETDPDAILRYNDYSLENPVKRRKLITLIKSLQAQHIPVMAIGTQTHVSVSYPSFAQEDATLTDLEQLGLPIHITELDVNGAQAGQRNTVADVANNAATTQGGLVAAADQRLADEYAALFRAFVKHRNSVKLVTFWGINDALSWRADGHPLLFDANDTPKPALNAVLQTARH
jgi:endo-1,4-beta-xylanase